MSVWKEIDILKAKYEGEFNAVKNAVEGEGAIRGSLSCDEFGVWRCRYIPKGERKQETLSAKGGLLLARALKEVRQAELEAEKKAQAPRG